MARRRWVRRRQSAVMGGPEERGRPVCLDRRDAGKQLDGRRRGTPGAESNRVVGGLVALSRCHENECSAAVPSESASQLRKSRPIPSLLVGCPSSHRWRGVAGRGHARSVACWRCCPVCHWLEVGCKGWIFLSTRRPTLPRRHHHKCRPIQPYEPTFADPSSKIQAALYSPAGVLPDSASLPSCHQTMRDPPRALLMSTFRRRIST